MALAVGIAAQVDTDQFVGVVGGPLSGVGRPNNLAIHFDSEDVIGIAASISAAYPEVKVQLGGAARDHHGL